MSDIAFWDEEYNRELDTLTLLIANAGKAEKAERENILSDCEAKIARIRDVKKSFGLEMRLIKDKNNRSLYEEHGRMNEQRTTQLLADLKNVVTNAEKQTLLGAAAPTAGFGPAGGTGPKAKNKYSVEGKDNDELLSGANQIQDKTFEAVNRIKARIEESKQVGTATLETLQQVLLLYLYYILNPNISSYKL